MTNVSTSLTNVSTGVSTSLSATQAEPSTTGITALRNAGLDPLRLWTLKAPKDAGGTIGAVFLQGDSRVVIMHQFASGKFALFGKIGLDELMGEE